VSYCPSGVVKISGCESERQNYFQQANWRSNAFYAPDDVKMVAFTNALAQRRVSAAVLLSLAPLVLQQGCVGSTKKILLVEDNNDVRELLALFIKRLGYQVFEATTGLEAIDQASTVQPDLIMMDLRLPEMNGAETTARLKANPSTREIPVLVITAYGAGIDTRRALDMGAAGILHKPIDLTTLRNVLRRYLSARTKKGRSSRKKCDHPSASGAEN
jgi:CheY-like chemotaxis protein